MTTLESRIVELMALHKEELARAVAESEPNQATQIIAGLREQLAGLVHEVGALQQQLAGLQAELAAMQQPVEEKQPEQPEQPA